MSRMTQLAGKVFVFSLPEKENNYCRLLKDEEKFISKVLELKGCNEIQGVNITGAYAITFDIEDINMTDEEIMNLIDEIANEIGFY